MPKRSESVDPKGAVPAPPDPSVRPGDQPPPEDQFGGGDICSPEEQPSTEDDIPLE